MNPLPLSSNRCSTVLAFILSCGVSAQADIIFSEDFETPDVDIGQSTGDTSGSVPTGWVGATEGFGATRRGIADESAGAFIESTGEQSFAFRYTNSGLTSAEGVIGVLTLGATYTVNFDAATDSGDTPFHAQLVAFPDGAARNDTRGGFTNFTLLDSLVGDASTNTIGTNASHFSFTFSPDIGTHGSILGDDVAIRFIGATTSAIIDNVSVDVTGVVPEPATLSLFGLGALALWMGRRTIVG